jgi:hypothetical protein
MSDKKDHRHGKVAGCIFDSMQALSIADTWNG